MDLKLPPPPISLLHYLAKRKWSTIQQYIHISDNNMLHVRQYPFHEFLYVFFLPDTDIIMTLLQYFVCSITQSVQL